MGARGEQGRAALARALVAEVRKRAPNAAVPDAIRGLDVQAFARAKLAPMVHGLFAMSERKTVLDLLARSIVFLTPENIEPILCGNRWSKTAWDIANLYLSSFGAEPLSETAPPIVGLSEETTWYVSVEYFLANGRFEDFIVHEAAHVFHNCKRQTIGLPYTRRREWILHIAFAKREMFAYACEAYSRILELGRGPTGRRTLLTELRREPPPEEAAEYLDVLSEAVAARNGWKRILARCAPPRTAPWPPGSVHERPAIVSCHRQLTERSWGVPVLGPLHVRVVEPPGTPPFKMD